ncbi:MAG TPA: hypothetical protein VI197_06280 [Polyangiaceae bacterium]
MSPGHVERLRQRARPSMSGDSGFLQGLTDSDRELADSIAEETVAHMTSGQQHPPSVSALEDFAELSIDVAAPDSEIGSTSALALGGFEEDPEQ